MHTSQNHASAITKAYQNIQITHCWLTLPSSAVFSPHSKAELENAVKDCVALSPVGNCTAGSYGPIGEWDVSKITDMIGIFKELKLFNLELSKWDVSSVSDMSSMFYHATSFNQDLSKWDISSVTNMDRMFDAAKLFNQDLSEWNVSSVTNMGEMFSEAKSFNQDVSKWNVSRVADMGWMFYAAKSFDHDLSKWDVSSVTYMNGMFAQATRFNHDLSKWDVSRVTTLKKMFNEAHRFDHDLSKWDVSKVTDMTSMFEKTDSFTQSLCGAAWVNAKADSKVLKSKMFANSRGSIAEESCGNAALLETTQPRTRTLTCDTSTQRDTTRPFMPPHPEQASFTSYAYIHTCTSTHTPG